MICMMNVPYVVLKYATLLLSFPINNVVEVVLTTLSAILKCTNNPSHLQGIAELRVVLSNYVCFITQYTTKISISKSGGNCITAVLMLVLKTGGRRNNNTFEWRCI